VEENELMWVMMKERVKANGEGVEVDFGFGRISAARPKPEES
jgi:hypothetical protein